MSDEIVILGAGGHAVSLAETAAACGYFVTAFVDPSEAGKILLGIPVVSQIPDKHHAKAAAVALATGDNWQRQCIRERLLRRHPNCLIPPLVHPSASVSRFAAIGDGSVVLQGAVVGSAAVVGEACIVNSGAVVEHGCSLAHFSSIGPGVALGGSVSLGLRTAIGIGATVRHGVNIGDDVVVGAHSYVNAHVEKNVVVYGVPARIHRRRQLGDSYLDSFIHPAKMSDL